MTEVGGVRLVELSVADAPQAWAAAGFDVGADGSCAFGSVRLRFVGRDAGRGVVGWALAGIPDDLLQVDGVPTVRCDSGDPIGSIGSIKADRSPTPHENGTTRIDHLVVMTPDLDRTVTALSGIGLAPRRRRDAELGGAAVQQVFYRLADVIVEVVGDPDAHGTGPASVWGITFTVADLDATGAALGDGVGPVKDAVQPGRRIATLRHRSFDMSVAVAFISERP